mmetsp:Transcript_19364/g.21639  ORF Transcript_19364/g.21639 Transcript_19364/m.21639 type:complete len:333 (+) Transcript_19364:79-1077(+)
MSSFPPKIDDDDDSSNSSNEDIEKAMSKTLNEEGEEVYCYDAATIREEFRRYQSVLPKPDKLLQEQHSCEVLREIMEKNDIEMPRFLKEEEGAVKPHYALCRLLLEEANKIKEKKNQCDVAVSSCLVGFLSFGCLYRQNHVPADIIREQFGRVAHVISTEEVRPRVLRRNIRHRSLPVPNFFLDPEDTKQFPPHIALIVLLQDGEKESSHLNSALVRVSWSLFAFTALALRLVLEVIGGAGAIWGGSEVFGLRGEDNKELWRWLSIAVGILCFLRVVTLNVPRKEDGGDILGPAGPWSLRAPVRLRAVCEHPFHYFVRAQGPTTLATHKKEQ